MNKEEDIASIEDMLGYLIERLQKLKGTQLVYDLEWVDTPEIVELMLFPKEKALRRELTGWNEISVKIKEYDPVVALRYADTIADRAKRLIELEA